LRFYGYVNYTASNTVSYWLLRIINSVVFYSPFDKITAVFQELMEIESSYTSNSIKNMNIDKIESNIGVAFWCVMGIICLVLLYFTFKKQRVEKVEDISNSPIGYKFLIPFYVISFMLVAYDPLIVVIGVIAMLVAYIVYRRTFKIKKWDIIMIGITIVIGIGVGIADYVIESNRTVGAGVYLCENVFQYISL